MPPRQAPQDPELRDACRAVKHANPHFGVKRVFKELESTKPRWKLSEKRVQRCMKKHGLTNAAPAAGHRR